MDLRPRGSAELVDVSVRLLRRHHARFAMMAAMGAVPLVLALGLVGRTGASGIAGWPAIGAAALAVAAFAWCVVVDTALSLVAADAYHGRTPSVAGALGAVFARLGAVVVARSLRGVLSLIATVLTITAYGFGVGALGAALPYPPFLDTIGILGAVAAVAALALVLSQFVPVPMALLVERTGPFESFERAHALTRGMTRRVACTLALVWAPTAAIAVGTLVALAALDANGWVVTVVFALFFGAAQPLTRVVAVLAYYDLRIRKEGYDIEMLAAATPLRAPAPVGGSPVAPAGPGGSPAPRPPAARADEAHPGLPGDQPAATLPP
ncbi:MAG TPA: hypothetical protein VF041_15360 [Gemmatimonadaceae bacterium]